MNMNPLNFNAVNMELSRSGSLSETKADEQKDRGRESFDTVALRGGSGKPQRILNPDAIGKSDASSAEKAAGPTSPTEGDSIPAPSSRACLMANLS